MDNSPRLSGDEWQFWANRLLHTHYGPGEYQIIPDTYKGDAGLEGFTTTEGHAYQIYGPEEPLSTVERCLRHKTKITNDIHKFINNRSQLSAILGTVKIHRWILLVPVFDNKETLIHANKKNEEVLTAHLSYVSDDFRILIQDERAFSAERDALINSTCGLISIDGGEINQQRIDDWTEKNLSLVQTIDDKLSRHPTLASEQRYKMRMEVIRTYLLGQNILDDLRKYPTVYEEIRKIKSQKERYLALESLKLSGLNGDLFANSLKDIEQTVREQVRGVGISTIEALAYEAVSDWIIRCPLDFQRNH